MDGFWIDEPAGVLDGSLIFADAGPGGLIVGDEHGDIEVETEDDIAVTFGDAELIEGIDRLPSVGADDDFALRFVFTDGGYGFGNQFVPVFGIVGDGFVHQFVGHEGYRIALQLTGEVPPKIDEFFLFLRVRPEGFFLGVEMMGAEDVQIDNHLQFTLLTPLNRIVEQIEGFLVFVA